MLINIKRTILFALALVVICIVQACTKEQMKNKVVFGNSARMSVTAYDSTFYPVQYGHLSWGNTIDLNDDGKDDIQFHSESIGSPAVGRDIVTKLNCLNENVSLLGDLISQEKYLHFDTTSHTEDSITWVVIVTRTYTCNPIAETDSLLSITEKLANIGHNSGDSYGTDDTFKNMEVVLKNRSYFYPGGDETVEDVTYHCMIEERNDCDNFPMDEEKYIGFKIIDNNKSRLGWMKVILHHDYVELLETAIQK